MRVSHFTTTYIQTWKDKYINLLWYNEVPSNILAEKHWCIEMVQIRIQFYKFNWLRAYRARKVEYKQCERIYLLQWSCWQQEAEAFSCFLSMWNHPIFFAAAYKWKSVFYRSIKLANYGIKESHFMEWLPCDYFSSFPRWWGENMQLFECFFNVVSPVYIWIWIS